MYTTSSQPPHASYHAYAPFYPRSAVYPAMPKSYKLTEFSHKNVNAFSQT